MVGPVTVETRLRAENSFNVVGRSVYSGGYEKSAWKERLVDRPDTRIYAREFALDVLLLANPVPLSY